jgi:siderophore synthetase component
MVAPGTSLRVTPTLSMRTVAVSGQPDQHIKLPLPTSTLGLLNRRFIPPGTLADGALVRRVLATIITEDGATAADATGADDAGAQLGGALLLADESSYAHAGHPYLGYLLRRLPPGLGRCRIVPVAALLAPSPAGVMVDRWEHPGTPNDPLSSGTGQPTVIEELAGWAWDGDLLGLFGEYLDVLFGIHVRLFARYGIALESHQQNIAVVIGPPGDPVRLRLLVKDFDSTLIHLPRLAGALGSAAPDESAFADPRLVTRSDDALADVFITITVHLCAGALAFDLARRGAAPLPDLLALVRRKLIAALDRQAGWPATAVLRSRVLDAARLPGKSMVTAGTLVAKSRTGANDINKFYGTDGPNYLKYLKPDDNDRSCQ